MKIYEGKKEHEKRIFKELEYSPICITKIGKLKTIEFMSFTASFIQP